MKKLFLASILALVAVALTAGAGTAAPTATITFELVTTGGLHPSCQLVIRSSKEISNYTVNGVKTELQGGTTTLVLNVQNGDVITVKAGTTVATYTVTGCLPPDDHHGGDDHGGDDGGDDHHH